MKFHEPTPETTENIMKGQENEPSIKEEDQRQIKSQRADIENESEVETDNGIEIKQEDDDEDSLTDYEEAPEYLTMLNEGQKCKVIGIQNHLLYFQTL